MVTFSGINWFGVVLAFAAYFCLGALWYMFLFKKHYAASLGKAGQELQNTAPIFIVGPAVCSLIVTITGAVLINSLHITTYPQAMGFALLTGFGYLFTNTVNIAINPNMPKPLYYGVITGMFHLTGSLLISVILVAMV